MGEVYRATDTNLKRQVAIKVLPAAVAADIELIARFQREAEMLAALNHSNNAHIHGLEKSDGTIALVMELVEGPTLAERITKGPVPLDEAIPIATQIAEALEAAHERGIIHRERVDVADRGKLKTVLLPRDCTSEACLLPTDGGWSSSFRRVPQNPRWSGSWTSYGARRSA